MKKFVKMSCRRIQKLLYSSEYDELEDIVLLESPFAEITREGKGIRQMQIALTPTKLILAQDIFDEDTPADKSKNNKKIDFETVAVSPDVDAEIESLELVSIIPINLVSLSLFVQGKKRALKARLRNGQVSYFELGGSRHRKLLWKLWSDKVKCLSPAVPISLSSETSTSNSSSHANAYVQKKYSSTTSFHKSKTSATQLRSTPQAPSRRSVISGIIPSKHVSKIPEDMKILRTNRRDLPSTRKPWTDRNLFPTDIDDNGKGECLRRHPCKAKESPRNPPSHDQCKGDSADKRDDKFSWSVSREVELNLINERQMTSVVPRRQKCTTSEKKESQRSILVNRFDSGVSENCKIGLYLVPLDVDGNEDDQLKKLSSEDFINLIDSGVRIWEECSNAKRKRKSHSRDLGAFPHFYNGLGPIGNCISLSEKRLLQLRHAKSTVQLNYKDISEISLPVPKYQLTATISYDDLTLPFIVEGDRKRFEDLLRKFPCTPLHLTSIHFWMPDLSYQPKSANTIYLKQRSILENSLSQKFSSQEKSKKTSTIPTMSGMNLHTRMATNESFSENDRARKRKYNTVYEKEIRRKICISSEENLRCAYHSCKLSGQNQDMNGKSLTTFQPMLKFRIKITAWDFTSTTLAYQLTMIERDLFIQIPVSELGLIIYQKYHLKEKSFFYPFASIHNGTPYISALISFSHRISCLVSSAILEGKSIKVRARSIVHFINVAHKCFQLQNFQSCRSILFGLQSPAIFRLSETWKYVKRKQYIKYEIFKHLCRFYINVQLTGYSCISKNSRRMPFLPCINFILNYLQEIKANTEVVNESHLATSFKESGQKNNIDVHNTINAEDIKSSKQQSDLSDSKNDGSNDPKVRRSKLINFLSSVFRINKRQKNSQQQFSKNMDKLSEGSLNPAKNNHASHDCSCWADIPDKTLKLYFSPLCKDRSSSKNLDQENYSSSHREVGYMHGSLHEDQTEIFKKTAETLSSSQYCAYNYALPQSDLAKEYLLNAKYKEHEQNYELSLQVENS